MLTAELVFSNLSEALFGGTRAVSCEMHQDFAANARVPPKSAPGRLENARSAAS
ncbi:hypothetical protein [Robinsoniella peoriensis]|uniref:hypothetical protein n=1 Tax=Robinsoniella peoriensis TaxID=180332 RepID=UPI003671593D